MAHLAKLISWNVNGLRSCVGKGFMDFFALADADVFCLQECKLQPGALDLPLNGYYAYYNYADKKGYSGTAMFVKREPLAVTYGIGADEHDHEGRVITLEYPKCYVATVYTPNSQRELLRLPYRMAWEDAMRAYFMGLDRVKPVIFCGDLNVAHTKMDIKNASSNVKNAGFTAQEREKISALLGGGFVDTYLYFHPDKSDAYTWWSYFGTARERNIGWRIDYFLASEKLKDRLIGAEIHPGVFGSDHCPVELTVEDAVFV